MPFRLTERQLQQSCEEWIALDGWRCFRLEQNFSERKIKLVGERGAPDYMGVRYSKVPCAEILFIEWKRQRGGNGKKALFTKAEKAKIHQIGWHALERERGALVWLAGEDFEPTIESFQNKYRESGLMRRKI